MVRVYASNAGSIKRSIGSTLASFRKPTLAHLRAGRFVADGIRHRDRMRRHGLDHYGNEPLMQLPCFRRIACSLKGQT